MIAQRRSPLTPMNDQGPRTAANGSGPRTLWALSTARVLRSGTRARCTWRRLRLHNASIPDRRGLTSIRLQGRDSQTDATSYDHGTSTDELGAPRAEFFSPKISLERALRDTCRLSDVAHSSCRTAPSKCMWIRICWPIGDSSSHAQSHLSNVSQISG